MTVSQKIGTGIPAMDKAIGGLRGGDNVVWQTEDAADLIPFAESFARQAADDGRRFIYIRFAGHDPLIDEKEGVRIIHFDLDHKFEDFTVRLYKLIRSECENTCYLFDSLSQL